MERELSDVMAEAVAARARDLAGLTPGPEALAGMRVRVRRRRAVRHGLHALALAPVAGALAVAALVGHEPASVPPVGTSSPTPTLQDTPSPTSSPEPTPSPTPTAAAPEQDAPVLRPGLPPFHEAPDGVLDEAGRGWFLVTWQTYRRDVEDPAPSDTSVFLVDPEGTRYRLTTLPTEVSSSDAAGPRWTRHSVVDWEAGASTAVVRVDEGDGTPGRFAGLDLRSGVLQELPAATDPVWSRDLEIAASTSDGTRLWRDPWQDPTVLVVTRGGEVRRIGTGVTVLQVDPGPDGRLAWVGGDDGGAVVDLDGGDVLVTVPAGETSSGWCEVVAWWTAEEVLQTCWDAEPFTEGSTDAAPPGLRLVTADLEQLRRGTSTPVRTLAPDDLAPLPWGSANLGDGVVAVAGMPAAQQANPSGCPAGAWLVDADGARRIDPGAADGTAEVHARVQRVGDRVVVQSRPGCHEAAGPDRLVAYDAVAGVLTDLAGAPHGGTYLGGPVSWVAGR